MRILDFKFIPLTAILKTVKDILSLAQSTALQLVQIILVFNFRQISC